MLPNEKEWIWLRELTRTCGLYTDSGQMSRSRVRRFTLAIKDMELISLLDVLSNQVITKNGFQPWSLEYILEMILEDEESSKELDTQRRYLHEKLAVLATLGFVDIVRAKDFQKKFGIEIPVHGRTNLYILTGKGLISRQFLSIFPYLFNKHSEFIMSSPANLMSRFNTFDSYFVLLRNQGQLNSFIRNGKIENEHNSLEKNLRDQIAEILKTNQKLFTELVSPLTYFLSEYYWFWHMRFHATIARKHGAEVGFQTKYLSFILDFLASEIKKLGYKNPKDIAYSLFLDL